MSLCCTTYQRLGCFNHCDPINTEIFVTDAGTYIVQLEFNNGIQSITLVLGAGDEIIIDPSLLPGGLNESYIYTFRVLDEDGEVLNETCYKFQTMLIDSRVVEHEVIYLNNISGLTLSGTGTDTLTLTMTDAEYINGTVTPDYRVNDGNGGDFDLPLNGITGMDISNFADGDYVGYIYCNDGYTISKLNFKFTILNFLVDSCMPLSVFLLDNFTATSNLALDITTQTDSDTDNITEVITKANAVTQDNTSYSTPVITTGQVVNLFAAIYTNSLQTITHGVELSAHGILYEHIAFFKYS